MSFRNIECTAINDGGNAISIIENNSFNLIILDLAMPEFSGFSVLEKLEKKDLLSSNNIVVLTATPIAQRDESLLKSYGVKKILKKPADMSELIETLETYA